MSNITKQALANALKSQIKKKNLSEITIADLTETCGLKRQTFYYHFKDIYELLKWLYTNEIIEEIKDEDTYHSWKKCYLYLFNYTKRNKKLIIETYNSIAKDYFHSFLNRQTKTFISKIIEEKTTGLFINEDIKSFLSNYYKNVLIGFIKDWIEGGMKEEPSILIDNIECILDGSIDLFLKNVNNRNLK